jgi:hypothetical protein
LWLVQDVRVLVPTFNDLNDRVALNIIAELMRTQRVVGIHAVDLVWGLGTLHCLTQQEPRGRGTSTTETRSSRRRAERTTEFVGKLVGRAPAFGRRRSGERSRTHKLGAINPSL